LLSSEAEAAREQARADIFIWEADLDRLQQLNVPALFIVINASAKEGNTRRVS
jgi:hypothetical protein